MAILLLRVLGGLIYFFTENCHKTIDTDNNKRNSVDGRDPSRLNSGRNAPPVNHTAEFLNTDQDENRLRELHPEDIKLIEKNNYKTSVTDEALKPDVYNSDIYDHNVIPDSSSES